MIDVENEDASSVDPLPPPPPPPPLPPLDVPIFKAPEQIEGLEPLFDLGVMVHVLITVLINEKNLVQVKIKKNNISVLEFG